MRSVPETPELRRVRDLPRRAPIIEQTTTDELTELLGVFDKCPGARLPPVHGGLCSVCDQPMRLRPKQALALLELPSFLPLGVGEGKTLITALAPEVLDSRVPLLLLPANLIEKTHRDLRALSKHWRIPRHIRLMSYQMLGRAEHNEDLHLYKPDLILADEAHWLKNTKGAAVARRVRRYMDDYPATLFVPLSGTMMRRSPAEFGQMLRWALKEDKAPVPKTKHELEEWASALEEDSKSRVREAARMPPGALLQLCNEEECGMPPLQAARSGFRRRLLDTAGVVATAGDGERVDASIYISAITYSVSSATEDHFERLRRDWELPSGEPLTEAVAVWRHARELALGLHYEWKPPAPKDWLNARREWSAFVRQVLSRSRTLDSEKQVADAVLDGRLADGGLLSAWLAIKPSFTPNTVPVWHDDSAIKTCVEWMKRPGVVWTEHYWFAEKLARVTGAPYYGAKGLDAAGRYIDDAPEDVVIASVKANREGRNLQRKWNRCLFVSPPAGADIWEQAIGRLHRPGQRADEVIVDMLFGCAEHADGWRQAVAAAHAIRDTTGAPQKILSATVDCPTDNEVRGYVGARWFAPNRPQTSLST